MPGDVREPSRHDLKHPLGHSRDLLKIRLMLAVDSKAIENQLKQGSKI